VGLGCGTRVGWMLLVGRFWEEKKKKIEKFGWVAKD
jgi:hypothetical protein